MGAILPLFGSVAGRQEARGTKRGNRGRSAHFLTDGCRVMGFEAVVL
jgi:hypothetical protein